MHPFRKAVEDRDEAALQALLADDVVFRSPVAFKPYVGKPITAAILIGVLRVFDEVRYVREINDDHGGNHAFEFEAGLAGVPDVTVNGCDFLHVNADGLIDDFKVMVRPLSAANALAEAMAAQFPRIQTEAAELAGHFTRS